MLFASVHCAIRIDETAVRVEIKHKKPIPGTTKTVPKRRFLVFAVGWQVRDPAVLLLDEATSALDTG